MKMKHFISIDGEVYYVVKDQFGCHRCALYKSCLRNRLRLCHDFNFLCYFMKIKPMKPEDVHWEDFEFLETKVRYKGRILDKSGIATYIHETEALLGNHIWPLLSDIYWGDTTYNELKEKLKENILFLKSLSPMFDKPL